MQVHQKKGESLRDYMQQFKKATLDIDNVPDTICLSVLLHGLKRGRFLDYLLEIPSKTWNEVNDRSPILAQIRHLIKKPPPPLHDPSRADKSKHCDYHHAYGHNTEGCQHLKDKREFLARNGKLEGYVQKPYAQQPTQTHFVQRAEHTGDVSSIGEAKDRELPPKTKKIGKGGQSARGRKAYARQVMTVNKNKPLKQPFEEAEWENAPITFSLADYKRAEGELDVMMPYADLFLATIHIGIHNVNKVDISQPHLCMKFPTPQGIGVLKGNQKMARACYQDTFNKVELAAAWKAEPTEPVETVPLNPDMPERIVKVGTKLTAEERAEPLELLKVNQDVFTWTTNEMPSIPTELAVHRRSTIPIRRLVKPNGKWRICIDFTNLNEACPKDPHPLLNVEKLVERAVGHERMSFLDASSGYYQVQLLLDDQEKTAFYVGDAIYCYVMMTFGLKNAGKFLGYVVSKKGIEVNPKKVQAVQQMEPPKTINDVQRLTGRVVALHRFIARSAERCLPFFKALREPKNFQWTDECQQSFDELKQYLASAPLLSKLVEGECLYLYLGESLYLYLGVTKEVVRSVLLREQNKHQKPICYMSKVLQGAEHNYPLAEKAVFALVYTARKLRAYFQSHKIVMYTDLPLRKILQRLELSAREILSSLSSPWPFAQWGADLLKPFVKGKGGCTYLVVAVDYFTKWIESKPLSTTTDKKIKEFLFNSILCRFGILKRIIVDNGPQFRIAALRSFCNDYGIELALASVYTPQSNGQAESANKIILRCLKACVLVAHSNWVHELNKVLWSCCTTPSLATGETPFNLAYGAEVVIPVEVELPSYRSNRHNDPNNEQLLRENLDLVKESEIEKLQVGDLVLRKARLTNAYSHMGKLAPNWESPYMVVQVKRPGSYVLANMQGCQLPFTWNVHNLRRYYS
ncbi:hypothetical protein SLEP1_g16333 [Rubroshorea leprosula]|uniref:Integrase catalytic domain-containing protein n=1 Tax=Rubroshorea leprosula TaxID=152421 RepID=A0AAV5J155_9ROSI|nr:hypothetical protein SLEP1_g16333 [Rubroshorea leprosula]